jgi:hypothetical protein
MVITSGYKPMKTLPRLVFAQALLLMGCQTSQYTSFAPLDAKLEPVPNGGARYFVLVNTTGQDLHNFSFSAYLWNDDDWNPIRQQRPVKHYTASGARLEAGKAVRFQSWGMGIEDPILVPVSRVEVVGQCDEGHIRQAWQNNESGQLRPLLNGSRSRQP